MTKSRERCEICKAGLGPDHCTNGRCGKCHREHCTPGGSTSPGHGRGKASRTPKRTAGVFGWLPDPPAPPDYSTPDAITARAHEAALSGGCPQSGHYQCKGWGEHVKMLRAIRTAFKTDGKLYRDFRAAVAKARA